ncbi:T9SS type A sorting domain-containing protein [bacterium]|nr:T9SS type A sorting domain-containing protein [bacterium]
MKRLSVSFLVLLLLAAVASAQVYPPYGLAADLGLDGEVTLTWNEPTAGLNETFDTDPGASWNWLVDVLTFEDGYAKLDGSATNTWQTGAYEAMEFDNFTLTSTFEIQDGQTSSRGVMWCVNGPRDADFQGYGMYISSTSYSVWKYTAGSASSVITWTTGTGINTGMGAVNTMEVVGSGGTYDLYINGTYHNSFTDGDYPQGYVGVIEAYNITWYDDIFCTVGAMDAVPTAPAAQGTPIDGYFDDAHNPILAPMPVAEGVRVFDRYSENSTDEFLYYKIYRDGELIDTTTDEMYVDMLPAAGMYEYEVTAYYDEGESDPSGPVSVDWVAIDFFLTPEVTAVPESGGDVVYDIHLINTTSNTGYGFKYQTFVTLPGGGTIPRINNAEFNLMPYMNYTWDNAMLYVPAGAPEGAYTMTAIAGMPNRPDLQKTDSFPFQKFGAGMYEDFEDGEAQGFDFFVGPGSYAIEDGYCKIDVVDNSTDWGSGTYMTQGFDNFTASTTFMYEVTIGYSVGMLFRGNGTNDSDYNGYAVYISNTSYSAWVYTDGSPTNIIGWTEGTLINTGVGAVNTLEISASGANVDITINGVYEGSFTDATYADGYVGMTAAYTNETWFDEIGATLTVVDGYYRPVGNGELEESYRDPMGVPCAPYARGVAFDRSAEFVKPAYEVNPDEWVSSDIRFAASGQESDVLPTEFALENAYPNPFNPTTTLAVTLPEAAELTVNVFNITGQLVTTLANGNYTAGRHTLTFDASNLASGLYFVRATVPGQLNQTQKVMLVR